MAEKVRLADARMRFIDRREQMGNSPETIRCYNNVLGRLVEAFGDMYLENITRKHLSDWIYGLRSPHEEIQYGRKVTKDAIAPSTFNQYRTCLRAFFGWCQDEGYVRLNPVAGIPAIKIQRKARQQPSGAALVEMIESRRFPRDRVFLALLAHTALRSNEALRIQIGDIDLDAGHIRVTISKTRETDLQPVSLDLEAELRIWFAAYEAAIGRPLCDEDYLIPATQPPLIQSRTNGRFTFTERELVPTRPARRMERVVQEAMKAVGYEDTKGEGCHTIRRGAARHYFELATEDGLGDVAAMRETAALLHHSNLHTTEIYLGMTPEKNRRDRRLKGKPFLVGTCSSPGANVVSIPTIPTIPTVPSSPPNQTNQTDPPSLSGPRIENTAIHRHVS